MNENIEKQLHEAAVNQAIRRYPSGWAGAAAIRLASGTVLTSVAPEINNAALALCMEVGALLEANRLEEKVTHSLCVSRENENTEFLILSPCGICQERLATWGLDVNVAITNPSNELIFKTLETLLPHHWSAVNE